MSCHVMSCHVMSCHVMSCHVMSTCHAMSCVVLCYLCVVLPYLVCCLVLVSIRVFQPHPSCPSASFERWMTCLTGRFRKFLGCERNLKLMHAFQNFLEIRKHTDQKTKVQLRSLGLGWVRVRVTGEGSKESITLLLKRGKENCCWAVRALLWVRPKESLSL